jgi:hypothetical protein
MAVIDLLSAPDPEFELLNTECGVKAKFYQYAPPSLPLFLGPESGVKLTASVCE